VKTGGIALGGFPVQVTPLDAALCRWLHTARATLTRFLTSALHFVFGGLDAIYSTWMPTRLRCATHDVRLTTRAVSLSGVHDCGNDGVAPLYRASPLTLRILTVAPLLIS